MQIGQREAAPRRAQHAQPSHAILWVEQSASQRERVDDLWPVFQILQIDGAEGNVRFVQRLGDGRKSFARAAQNGDAIALVLRTRRLRAALLQNALNMQVVLSNQRNNLVQLA